MATTGADMTRHDTTGLSHLCMADSEKLLFFAKVYFDSPADGVSLQEIFDRKVRVGTEQERRVGVACSARSISFASKWCDNDNLNRMLFACRLPFGVQYTLVPYRHRVSISLDGRFLPWNVFVFAEFLRRR